MVKKIEKHTVKEKVSNIELKKEMKSDEDVPFRFFCH